MERNNKEIRNDGNEEINKEGNKEIRKYGRKEGMEEWMNGGRGWGLTTKKGNKNPKSTCLPA